MTPNAINNQAFSFLDSIASKAKPNSLGDKPILEKQSDQGFDKVIDDTIEPQAANKASSNDDTAEIYKAAQSALDKLKDHSDDDPIEIKKDDVQDTKDVYFLVFNIAQNQIENRVDDLTKQIAYLDLNSANGVEDILTKANLIEDLRGLEQGVQEGLKQLTALANPEELELSTIDPSLMKDLKFQVDNFIQQAQDQILAKNNQAELTLAPDLKANSTKNSSYQDLSLLKDLKLTIQSYKELPATKQVKAVDEDLNASEDPTIVAEIVLSKDNIKAEEKDQTTTKEPEQLLTTETISPKHDSAHSGAQDQFGSAFSNPTQINSVSADKLSVRSETININDLSNYLETQVSDIPQNKTQEIKLQITPDSIGKVDLVITKNEHNQVTIEMSFHSKEGLDHIKQDLKNTIAELREVLKSKDLDLSKFEVKESSSSRTAYDGGAATGSFNQAREEQKNKLQNTIPEWVKQKESSTKVSFKQVIEGI